LHAAGYSSSATFSGLDSVRANVLTINQSIMTLNGRATEINSTLHSFEVAVDNFTNECGADIMCTDSIPLVPVLSGLGEVG
jgi:ACT domain-containing protein